MRGTRSLLVQGKHYSCVRCEGPSPEEPHGADGVSAIYSTVKVSTSRGSWWQRCQLQGSSILGKHTKERALPQAGKQWLPKGEIQSQGRKQHCPRQVTVPKGIPISKGVSTFRKHSQEVPASRE